MGEKLTADVATVNRDEDGEILPEPADVDYGGTTYEAMVVPMATGEWKRHQRNGADFEEMNLKAIETLFEEYVAEPDVENIKDVRFGIAVQLIQAVVESSGLAGGGDLEEKLEDRVADAQESGNSPA